MLLEHRLVGRERDQDRRLVARHLALAEGGVPRAHGEEQLPYWIARSECARPQRAHSVRAGAAAARAHRASHATPNVCSGTPSCAQSARMA